MCDSFPVVRKAEGGRGMTRTRFILTCSIHGHQMIIRLPHDLYNIHGGPKDKCYMVTKCLSGGPMRP